MRCRWAPEEDHEWGTGGRATGELLDARAPRDWRLRVCETGRRAFESLNALLLGDHRQPDVGVLKRILEAGGAKVGPFALAPFVEREAYDWLRSRHWRLQRKLRFKEAGAS